MSTKLKKTLAATLAASIASGMAVVPAMAEPAKDNADALYAAAYNATMKAEKTGLQADIYAAREAIEALRGTGAEFAIGEFSRIVDGPQHKILVAIVDGIAEQTEAKVPSQKKINEIRAMIDGLREVEWKNSYSSALDKAQQKLIDNAVKAAEKALETGLEADIDAANKLLNELQTATNNQGVVDWAKAYQKEFNAKKFPFKVVGVKLLNKSNVEISLNRAIDRSTLSVEDIKIASVNDEHTSRLIKDPVVSKDGKTVTVTLVDELAPGKYNVTLTGVKDVKGVEITSNKNVIEYKAAEVGSIAFKKNNIVWSDNKNDILKYLVVKDSEGRDITNTLSLEDLEITSNNHDLVNVNGIIGKNKEDGIAIVTVKVKYTDLTTGEVTLNVEKSKATTFKEAVFTKRALNEKETLLSKVSSDIKVNKAKVDGPSVYVYASFLDQDGNEMPLQETKIENKSPLIADLDGAKVTGKQAGTLELVFKAGTAQGYKTFNVVPKSVDTEIKLTESVMNLAPTEGKELTRILRGGKTVLLDQYGDKIPTKNVGGFKIQYKVGAGYIDANTEDPNKAIDEKNKALQDKVDIAKLKINPNTGDYEVVANKEGRVEARIVYKNEVGKEFTAPLIIDVKGNKEIVKYEVKLVEGDSIIDKYDTSDELTIDLKGFNKNGANVGELKELKFSIEKDGKVIQDPYNVHLEPWASETDDINEVKIKTSHFTYPGDRAVGTYDIVLIHHTHEIGRVKIEVINSQAVPTTIIATSNSVSLNGTTVEEAIKKVLVVKDQYGTNMKVNSIDNADYFIENKEDGSYDVVFRKITITAENDNKEVVTKEVPLAENIRINVRAK